MPADPCQMAHYQLSNPANSLLIIMNNSNIGVYYSVFQGESDYQLCFSIGVMVLWQSAENTQNCVQIPIPPDLLVVEQIFNSGGKKFENQPIFVHLIISTHIIIPPHTRIKQSQPIFLTWYITGTS
jgi:hypothetical protein